MTNHKWGTPGHNGNGAKSLCGRRPWNTKDTYSTYCYESSSLFVVRW